MSSFTKRTTCRVCGSDSLLPLFSLGEQFVSDFVPPGKVTTGVKCPISLQLCGRCSLVQQEYTAPQDFLYTRHYWYRSGITETMRRALADVVDAAMDRVGLAPGDIVLDIGSNDGTLLRQYPKELELVRIGVEPATNMVQYYLDSSILLINGFWSADDYEFTLEVMGSSKQPKIITACGMFYDLEDPNQFIADVAKVLHPEGVFVAQLMCLKQTLEMRDIGNLAHEHLEFYSLEALRTLLNKHGLSIVDIEENNVNGGSYRIFAKLGAHPFSNPRVTKFFEIEREMGLRSPASYREWWEGVENNLFRIRLLLIELKRLDARVWVYGASTKGNVILQALKADNLLLEGAADKSSEKWGLYTIGTGICIHREEMMRSCNPSYLLVLPYAFIQEFVKREEAWLKAGGKFIVPLPTAHTIEWDKTSHTLKVTVLQ